MQYRLRLSILLFLLIITSATVSSQVTHTFITYVQGGPNSAEFTTNNFKCIGVGKGNVVWAGSQYGGLYLYNDTFNIWRKSSKLTDVFINDIKADGDSGIWIAQSGQSSPALNSNIAGGVNYFPVGSDISMNFYSVTGTQTGGELLSRNVKALYVDKSFKTLAGAFPRVWVASGTYITSGNTKRGGLNIGLNQYLPYFDSYLNGFSTSSSATPICESLGGNSQEVWMGTRQNNGGSKIMRYKPSGEYIGEISNTNNPNFVAGFAAQAIFFDRFGNKWVGLKDGGLRILTAAKVWVKMESTTFFPAGTQVNFNAMVSDEYGNLFIGTSNGLIEFESPEYNISSSPDYLASYKQYTTNNGLPNNNVTGLAYDQKNGRLLITTSGGVTFMNRREPFIKGVVYDVYCNVEDTLKPYPGYQKKPLSGGVRVALLKDNVEKESVYPDATGKFELKEANETDVYSVEVKYQRNGKTMTYVYNNIKNHRLLEPTLFPDSLIGEIKAFKEKLARRCFPVKLSAEIELNVDLFCTDGFDVTGYELATEPFNTPITTDHTKRVDNLANYYTALATVYKLGGDMVDLNGEAVGNLLDGIEALVSLAEFGIEMELKVPPGTYSEVNQALEGTGVAVIKVLKETLVAGMKGVSSQLDAYPDAKKLFDRFVSTYGEAADLLIEGMENGRNKGILKFLVDNIKRMVAQYIAVQSYDEYAREKHNRFIYLSSNSSKNAESKLTYTEAFDNLYNQSANSLGKYSTDTLNNTKKTTKQLADYAKVADVISTATEGASFLALIPGAQFAGAICKVLSLAAKGVKAGALFGAMYVGARGANEIVTLSEKIETKADLHRTGNEFANRSVNATDSLVVIKNRFTQKIMELQSLYHSTYDSVTFLNKYREFRKQDSAYSLELAKTLNIMWSSADSANIKLPGFKAKLNRVMDSFVSTQGLVRQAMFLQNAGYLYIPNKSDFTAGLDSICNELKLLSDSAVNGVVYLTNDISNGNILSPAYLVQEKFKINHSHVPGSSGTVTYTFVNRGNTAQNNVSFKINRPNGGYTITSPDSINVGTINPGQSVNISYNFSSPIKDSIGQYIIKVNAANGKYSDVNGAFYIIDPSKIYSVREGNWDDPATWSSNSVPASTNTVFIYHTVTVNVDASVKIGTISRPGKIVVNAGKNFKVLN